MIRKIDINGLPVFVWGDTHGNWNHIKDKLVRRVGYCNIIQVGDFGIGYKDTDKEELEELNELLVEHRVNLYIIRGNHDDPYYFQGFHLDTFSNIFFLPDYTVLNSDDVHILCVGGATSIDRRQSREQAKTYGRPLWWTGEKYRYDEEMSKLIASKLSIDIVITHTCPFQFHPTTMDNIVYQFAKRDLSLIDELIYERKEMSKMLSDLLDFSSPKYWYYGHFHRSHQEEYEGIKVRTLAIDELVDINIDRICLDR